VCSSVEKPRGDSSHPVTRSLPPPPCPPPPSDQAGALHREWLGSERGRLCYLGSRGHESGTPSLRDLTWDSLSESWGSGSPLLTREDQTPSSPPGKSGPPNCVQSAENKFGSWLSRLQPSLRPQVDPTPPQVSLSICARRGWRADLGLEK
jgi:hypothetical protein